MQYNVVDMTLNAGLGDITTKNQLLQTPVTEKLTAVTHTNGSDIWVIAHKLNSNEYIAYLVTDSGLDLAPIVSATGHTFSGANDARSYMKVSPNGKYLAIVGGAKSRFEILEFDTSTGLLSNPLNITPYYDQFTQYIFMNLYGVEFSQDSNLLYISNLNNGIHQFNLSSYAASDIITSGLNVAPTGAAQEMGALQLAIDGKIYVAQSPMNFLGVIDKPNVIGTACNYIENAVNLGSGISYVGLPTFIQSYFLFSFTADSQCLGDMTGFIVNTSEPITSISWDFGDSNSSTLENPTHTYATPGTYTVSVTANTVSETKTESKDITIYNVPVANTPIDFEICNTSPTYQFDLSTKNSEVLGAQLASDNTINYYPTLIDVQNGTNPLPLLYTNSNATETIFARISNVNNPSCFDTTSFDLIVKEAPVLNTVIDWTVCDSDTDGFLDFDLVQKDTEVLNGQSAITFAVTYHESLVEAQGYMNALVSLYTNTSASQTLFFRIENSAYPECFETGSFDLEVVPAVQAIDPPDLELCDDNNDGLFLFDLSIQDTIVLGTQNPDNFNVSYYSSQSDADNRTNTIHKSAYTNTSPYTETTYARVENNSNSNCYNTVSFSLRVYDSPTLQPVTDWQICDDDNDGFQIVDLTRKDTEILGGQPAIQYAISYHETQADADINASAIVGPYQNTNNSQTVYYRLENNSNSSCFLVNSFVLEVFDTPTANTPSPFVVCDTNENGIQTFDLSAKDAEILNGQDTNIYEVAYFANELDAINNQSPLSKTGYTNSSLNETIYARVHTSSLEACYAISNFEISIRELAQPILEDTYVICPDSPELSIDGGDFESWVWRDAQNNQVSTDRILNVSSLGTYSLTVSHSPAGLTCEKTISFQVVSSVVPEDFTTATSNFSDQIVIEVDAQGTGDFEYSSDGENFQDSNRLEVFPGTYTVYVRDKFLCRTITKEVIALGFQKFFTPNGDGTHEYWNIIGAENFPNSQIYIFNRQGKLLKQLSPESRGWDGTFQGVQLPASDYWFRFINEDGSVHTGHFSLKR